MDNSSIGTKVRLRLKLGGHDGLDRASRQCLWGIGGWRLGGGDGLMVRRKVEGEGRGRTGVLESLQVGDRTADTELANSTVLRITVYGIYTVVLNTVRFSKHSLGCPVPLQGEGIFALQLRHNRRILSFNLLCEIILLVVVLWLASHCMCACDVFWLCQSGLPLFKMLGCELEDGTL